MKVLQCYVHAERGIDRTAVGLCRSCCAGLCLEHLREAAARACLATSSLAAITTPGRRHAPRMRAAPAGPPISTHVRPRGTRVRVRASASELRQVVSADHAPGARSDAPRRLDARRGPLRRSRRSPFVAVEPMRRSRRRSSRRTEAIRRRRTAGSLIGTPPAPREAPVTFEPSDEVDLPMPTPASKGAGALTTRAFRRRTLPKWLPG